MLEWLFYALFFLLPLVFFPKTSEVFEFNKIVVLYVFTTLIIGSWIIKMIQEKRVIFKRTVLDIPLLLFLGSQLISTIISIDQRTSFFGYYSRFNGGLLSLICYSLLYWAFVSNFSKENCLKLIKITLISAAIVAIYGILEHFGASFSCLFVSHQFNDDCWVQDVRTRVFATLGQPNWLASTLISLVPLTWYVAFNTKKNRRKIIYIFLSIIFFACILFTKSRSGILGLAVASVIFGLFNFKRYFRELIVIAALFLVCIGIFGTPFTPSINELIHKEHVQQTADTSEGGTESGSIREIVWKGAINIWKANPIFGTGTETFGYSYWQYRPIAHNNTSEWDFLYNKAHNEYLNFAANTGSVGLITYLILIGISIYVLRKNSALFAGYISILVTNFFGFSVVNISLLTFIFPGMALALSVSEKKNKIKYENSNNQKLLIGGIIVAGGFILILIGRYWYADYLYNRGQNELQLGQYEASVSDNQDAINYSPTEAIYHNQMSRVFTDIAVGLSENNEATNAARLAPYALQESDIAFNLSPRNMNIRETRISTYLELAQFDPHYMNLAIDFTKETMLLSPTDPKLHLIQGKTYANLGQFKLAIDEFKEALKLKPDYGDAKTALDVVTKLQTK